MAAGLAKLQLLIDLKQKLSTGLNKAKQMVEKSTGQMQKRLDGLKVHHIQAFNAMENKIPGLSTALDLLRNPYTLLAAVIVAVGVAFADATAKAMEFEHEFMNIRNLNLQKPRSELDSYRMEILKTSIQTGISNKEMASGFYDLQSAIGVYGKDASRIAKLVGNYSVGTQATYTDSINATTKAMKAFGFGVDSVKSYLESNAKTVQVGIVTFADLAKVQTEYAGAAAAAGQNVDTANKIFAAFTSIAKNADTAANMTKTAFQGLADPKVLKQLGDYGVQVYDATGNMRSLDEIIRETSTLMSTMNDQKFNKFMGDVGGPEGLKALFGKLRTGADDFFKTMDQFNNTKFDLNNALANAKQDPTTLKNIVSQQWETIMTTIGLKFLPLVIKVLQPISDFLTKIFDLLDGSAKVSQEWAPYIELFRNSLALSFAPLRGLFGILKAIGTGLYNLYQNSQLLKDMGWLIGKAYSAAGKVLGFISTLISGIATRIEEVWTNKIFPIINRIEKAYLWARKLITGNDIQITRVTKDLPAKVSGDTGGVPDTNNPNNDPLFDSPDKTSPNGGLGAMAQSIGSGSQTKNTTINIDSFVKNFSPQHQSINNMSKDEIERWMTEMFLRVVRSAEMG